MSSSTFRGRSYLAPLPVGDSKPYAAELDSGTPSTINDSVFLALAGVIGAVTL